MALNLSILYRGPLSSCNYGCGYCPFAKRRETAAELAADRRALERFVAWVAGRPPDDRIAVLFTPWGEALTRRWYREALVRLTAPAAGRAGGDPDEPVVRARLGRAVRQGDGWPSGRRSTRREVDRARVPRAAAASWTAAASASASAWSGLKEHLAEIEALRRELPPDVYLWVNAYKRQPRLLRRGRPPAVRGDRPAVPGQQPCGTRASGRPCRAGRSVVSVDGDGTIRRCHFIREPIGNLYDPGFEAALVERPCTNATCGCHIGYVHLDDLGLDPVFGAGILERIPARPIWRGDESGA